MESTLKYPNMRVELLEHLLELGDQIYHDKWTSTYEFDEMIHFVYDDTSLNDNPSETIGVFMRNDAEIATIQGLISAVEALFSRCGLAASIEEYRSAPEWSSVVAAARVAKETIEGNDS